MKVEGDKGQTDHRADLKSEDSPSTDRRCDHSGLHILPERGGVAQGGPRALGLLVRLKGE